MKSPSETLLKHGRNRKKKIIMIACLSILLLIVAFLLFMYFMTVSSIKPMFNYRSGERNYDGKFALTPEEVSFTTNDNLKLYAELYIPKDLSKGIVILVPGWDMTHTSMYDHVTWLYNNGYGSLTVDLRTRGKSEGSFKGGGYTEVNDVEAAIAYIQTCDELKNLPIALIGHSLGGNTVLKVKNQGVKAIISLSGYTDYFDMLDANLQDQPSVLIPFIKLSARIYLGFHLGFDSLKSAIDVGKVQDAKIMIVHGRVDSQVPFSNGEQFSQAFGDIDGFVFLPLDNSKDHIPWLNIDSTIKTDVIDAMDSFLEKNLND